MLIFLKIFLHDRYGKGGGRSLKTNFLVFLTLCLYFPFMTNPSHYDLPIPRFRSADAFMYWHCAIDTNSADIKVKRVTDFSEKNRSPLFSFRFVTQSRRHTVSRFTWQFITFSRHFYSILSGGVFFLGLFLTFCISFLSRLVVGSEWKRDGMDVRWTLQQCLASTTPGGEVKI